jgi:hypothetical protein
VAVLFQWTAQEANFGCSRCDAMHLLVALGSIGIMLAAMYPRDPNTNENLIEFLIGGALQYANRNSGINSDTV